MQIEYGYITGRYAAHLDAYTLRRTLVEYRFAVGVLPEHGTAEGSALRERLTCAIAALEAELTRRREAERQQQLERPCTAAGEE